MNVLEKLAARGGGANNRPPLMPLYEGALVVRDETGREVPFLDLPPLPTPERGPAMKLTPVVAEIFIRAARSWNTQVACCALAGISKAILSEYKLIAESEPSDDDTPYRAACREYLAAFFRAYDTAMILAEREMFQVVEEAALKGTGTTTEEVVEGIDPATGKKYRKVTKRTVNNGPNIQAAMWILERLRPRSFGDKRGVEVTGEGGGPVEVSTPGGVTTVVILQGIQEGVRRMAEAKEALPQGIPAPIPDQDYEDDELYGMNDPDAVPPVADPSVIDAQFQEEE